MSYLTARIKQLNNETTSFALSAFMDDVTDANAQYWNMVANDINQQNVTEFTDFVTDSNGKIGKIRYYSRVATEEELKRWYYIKIETYTEESGKNPIKEIREYEDQDSAEVAFCKDNAGAEKNTDLLTGAHLVVNHHGDKLLFELYDNNSTSEELYGNLTPVTGGTENE